MTKKLILAMAILGLMVVGLTGCGGGGPKEEVTQSPASTETVTDDAGADTGNADRPGDRDVDSRANALAGLQTVYFDFDKYNLRQDAKEALDRNAEILRQYPDARITIEGHCDERGTNEYNLALGENRAKAARDYLVRLGIDASRISIISYGEEKPVAFGHDEASWAQNRRGEFVPE